MASLALGAVGAAIGGVFGGVTGAELGFAVGTTVGGLLFPPKLQAQSLGKIKDLRVIGSGYGSVIPQIFGQMRMHGNIIWSTDLKEVSTGRSGGKGGVRKSSDRKTIYTVNVAIAVCRGPIGAVNRIWAEDRVIYDVADTPATKYTIRIHLGTESQLQDSIIVNTDGASITPAYRGIAYVVFENWDLSSWGNRIPSTSFEVVDNPINSTTVAAVLADLFAQCGLSSSQYDVSAGTTVIKGLTIAQREPVRTSIEEFLRFYQYDLVDVDGKIVLVKRGGNAVTTIPVGDLASRVYAADQPPNQKVVTKRKQDMELPFRVDLTYYSPNKDYQQANQGSTRFTKINLQDALTIHTPLTLLEDQARQGAERAIYQQWTEREQFTIQLPPNYMYLTPGDVINVPVGLAGSLLRMRIISMDIGLFGPIQCECVLDSSGVLTQTVVGATVLSVAVIKESYDTTINAWTGNAIRDADTTAVGFYVALGASGDWPGATLYISRDTGSSYQILDTVVDPAVYGTTLTILPPGIETGAWDTVSTVDITLTGGTAPVSTSDADVLAGNNACMIGDEVVQFATVVALGGSSYRLSRLLRGRRGTDGHWTGHTVGERFVMLAVGQVHRYNLTDDYRGKTIYLKALSTNQTLSDVSPTTLVISGDEFKDYAPVQLAQAVQ